MTQTSENIKATDSTHVENTEKIPNFDLVATGVITGVIATAITETGRGAVRLLAKNPVVVFGVGVATGYFAFKYRKGIILTADKIKNQGGKFISRQKEHIDDLLTESDD